MFVHGDDLHPEPITCQICTCFGSSIKVAFESNLQRLCLNCFNKSKAIKFLPPFLSNATIDDVLIVPSNGSFLMDYNSKTGLHIGILQGGTQIWEYDKQGLQNSKINSKWSQSIQLNILEIIGLGRSEVNDIWKLSLQSFLDPASRQKWSKENYDSENYNCFNFVIAFLTRFYEVISKSQSKDIVSKQINELSSSLQDKLSFCQKFVIPRTRSASKYILLHRKISSYLGQM